MAGIRSPVSHSKTMEFLWFQKIIMICLIVGMSLPAASYHTDCCVWMNCLTFCWNILSLHMFHSLFNQSFLSPTYSISHPLMTDHFWRWFVLLESLLVLFLNCLSWHELMCQQWCLRWMVKRKSMQKACEVCCNCSTVVYWALSHCLVSIGQLLFVLEL